MRSFVLHPVNQQGAHRGIRSRALGPRVASAARGMTTRRILAAAFLKCRPIRASLGLAVALAMGAAGCHKSEAAQAAPGADAPPGQAWLTREQVAEAHIVVAPLEEQDVDDTILSSGRVTFDDQRVAHIFSPVTGRVATDPRQPRGAPPPGAAAGDHHLAGHRAGVERSREGRRRPHRRGARLQAEEGALRGARGLAGGLRDVRGQLPQGEGREGARVPEGVPPPDRIGRCRLARATR